LFAVVELLLLPALLLLLMLLRLDAEDDGDEDDMLIEEEREETIGLRANNLDAIFGESLLEPFMLPVLDEEDDEDEDDADADKDADKESIELLEKENAYPPKLCICERERFLNDTTPPLLLPILLLLIELF
jgi:hypothetical protein